MRAAIYARVSSAAQRDAHSIESQLHVLRAFVKGQGWKLVDVYSDDGRSAKTGMLDKREAFARCIRDAEAHRFDVLVVFDVDRLTRTDSIEERAQILGPFQRAGVRIVTPSSEIDLRTMFGQLDATLRSLYAAEENRKRVERIKAGKLRAIAEGRKPAGPTPYGWSYSREAGEWSLDPPAAAILREIFHRVAHGESCVAIARDLIARDARPAPRTGWTRAAVYRIVRKRTAVGEWCADKRQRVIVSIPPIVTEREWQAAARALLAHKRRGLRRTRHVYLLEGIAVCGQCGAPIAIRSATTCPTRTNGNPSPAAYVCRSRKLEGTCNAPVIKVGEADDRVWSVVELALRDPSIVEEIRERMAAREANCKNWEDDARAYKRRLEKLEQTEAAVLARFRRGTISETALDRELAEIKRERDAVTAQLKTARAASARSEAQASAEDIAAELRLLAQSVAPAARQRVVRAIVPEAVLRPDGKIRVVLEVDEPETDVALVDLAGYRKQREDVRGIIRRKLVA